MNTEEKILELLNTSKNGVITTTQVTNLGLHRGILKKLVNNSIVHPVGRGLYVQNDAWEDDFYLLQRKYERGIYSHDTALYLLGYSDRTPAKYTMTFPKGYNAPSLKNENVIIKRVILENYNFGKVEIESPSGNLIYIYDLERSLCDMLRGNSGDIEIINEAMKRYVKSKNKDINKLLKYADQLHVKTKVQHYLEVLL
jgi:predicted transcriptional regulator of viral defense system